MSSPAYNDATVAYQPDTATPGPNGEQRPRSNVDATVDQHSRPDPEKPKAEESAAYISGVRKSSDSSILGRLNVPGYEILEELGRGGMGVVYKARQKGLNRLVALKMILAAEHAGKEQRARFQAEGEAVAQLQHPNIVQVYDVGAIEDRPFFSLEFVDGGNLAQTIAGKPQTPRHAAALVQTLASAMAAAHAIGIIHRDLKPANILLGKSLSGTDSLSKSFASSIFLAQHPYGIPKITDFGLAKRLEGSGGQTQSGAIMGTPAYMAPEQASGRIKEIGPATDVYALGAILYEMLSGAPPFVSDSPLEVILKVIRDEPESLRVKNPKIPRDLDIISLKCLEKQPDKRYPSSFELAEDLKRFLEGEPISARAATQSEKIRKWIRAHPTYAGMIAFGAVSLVLLVAFGLFYNAKLQKALALAEEQRDKLGQEREAAHERMIRLTVQSGSQFLQQGDLLRSLPLFAEALRLESGDVQREEMHRIRIASVLRQCPMPVRAWFHEGKVEDAAFSPDGKWVAAACAEGVAAFYSLDRAGSDLRDRKLKHPAAVTRVAFSPDGLSLATACADGHARIWKLETGKELVLRSDEDDDETDITSLSFSRDGLALLTTGRDGFARIWDVATGQETLVAVRHAGAILYGEFAASGDRFLTCSADQTARVWDAVTGKPISPVLSHSGPVVRAHFSPDGEKIVTACQERYCQVWTVKTGEPFGQVIRLLGKTTDCSFSPAGTQISTANQSGHARVWNLVTKDFRPMVMTHEASIVCEVFSPDGLWVATGSEDNSARVWNAVTGEPVIPPLRHNGTIHRVRFSPDGGFLLTASDDGSLRLWDLTKITDRTSEDNAPVDENRKKTFSRDRRYFVTVEGRTAKIFDTGDNDKEVGKSLVHKGAILSVCFSPDGRTILTTSADRTARMWRTETGEPVGEVIRHGSEVLHGTFSPDGSKVATASADNTARVCKAETGEALVAPLVHPGTVINLVFSEDSRCLVTECSDQTVRVWDVSNGELISPILKATGWVKQALPSAEKTQSGWDLAPDRRSTEILVLLSKWLSSQRVDEGGNLIQLGTDALQGIQDSLREKFPALFEVDLQTGPNWQIAAAERAEANKEWFAAAFHLKRALLSDQKTSGRDAVALEVRLGFAQAELGDWKAAADSLAVAIKYGKEDERILMASALAYKAIGDTAAFAEAVKKLVERAGDSAFGNEAARIAWICLLSDSKETMKYASSLIERISNDQIDAASLGILKGALLYRGGEFEKGIEKIQEVTGTSTGIDIPRAFAFVGLCECKRKNAKEAERSLNLAESWRKKNAASLGCLERLQIDLILEELKQEIAKTPQKP